MERYACLIIAKPEKLDNIKYRRQRNMLPRYAWTAIIVSCTFGISQAPAIRMRSQFTLLLSPEKTKVTKTKRI